MRKITKKVIKRIKKGYHDDLMEAIEFLVDTYNEDKFDAGYRCCMDDLSVRSYRLAEHILKESIQRGFTIADTDDTTRAIEEYFNEALKE